MENKTRLISEQDEDSFSIKDFVLLCLSHWQWFLCSVIFCVGLGIIYGARQEPVFKRTSTVLIKDQDQGNTADIANMFSSMGLVGSKTNVNNELISLTSPAVMFEVVRRLNLMENYNQTGKLHPVTLYGKNNPIVVSFPDLGAEGSGGFTMTLQPDGSFHLEDFYISTPDGIKKFDDEIDGRLGLNAIRTPLGRVTLAANPKYVVPKKSKKSTHGKEREIKVFKQDFQSTVETYSKMLKGDLVDQDAEVIELEIDDVSIERSTDILNSVVAVYNEFWVEDKNRLAIATSDFITERLRLLEGELGDVDNDISAFKSAHRVPDLAVTATQAIERDERVNRELLEVTNHLAMAQYLKDYLNNPANARSVIPMNTGTGNQMLESQIAEFNRQLFERDNLMQNSSSANPLVQDMETKLRGLRESIIRSVNAQIGTLSASLQTMRRAQGESESELESSPKQAKYLLSVERQQKVKEELFLYLLQKREENDLSQTFTAYNTRIITPPYGPLKPVAPRKSLIVFVAFILGLTIPGVSLYVAEQSNTKIRSRKDLENLPVPFLGEIPHIGKRNRLRQMLMTRKQRHALKEAPKPVVVEGRRDVPNEAFRVVRSNIDFMLGKEKKCNVILTTSFNPGSGKSFIVYNLGVSFALKRKRVLLIDADLRHGSLSAYVGSPKKGLSDYLTENSDDWESLLIKTKDPVDLDVLPIGHRPPNPAELLDNGRFGRLIKEVREHYDVVLIDCPPINIVVDTQIIEAFVDRSIFVVRAGLLERSALTEVNELYEQKKLRNMSILLNGTDSSYSSYYTYGNYQALEKDR